MDEAVDGRERHGLVGEDPAPLAEGLVGGDEHGAALVARSDEFEENAGLGLILGDIGDVVEDEEIVAVEFAKRAFERQFPPCDLEPFDKIGGASEQDAPAILDKGKSQRRREMALAGARRAEHQDIGAVAEPGVA